MIHSINIFLVVHSLHRDFSYIIAFVHNNPMKKKYGPWFIDKKTGYHNA
jgi:hypothetical protein